MVADDDDRVVFGWTVRCARLLDNSIGAEGCTALANALHLVPSLKVLLYVGKRSSSCFRCQSQPYCRCLVSPTARPYNQPVGVCVWWTVHGVRLKANSIGPAGCAALASALGHLPSLTSLEYVGDWNLVCVVAWEDELVWLVIVLVALFLQAEQQLHWNCRLHQLGRCSWSHAVTSVFAVSWQIRS